MVSVNSGVIWPQLIYGGFLVLWTYGAEVKLTDTLRRLEKPRHKRSRLQLTCRLKSGVKKYNSA